LSREQLQTVVIGLVVLLAQVSLAPLLEVAGFQPDLLLIFVLVITARSGGVAGLIAGFLVGLSQDFLIIGFPGVLALIKSNIAFWSGRWLQGRDATLGVWGWTLFVFFCTLIQNSIEAIFIYHGSEIGFLTLAWRFVLPSSAYTALIALLWTLAPIGERSRQPLRPIYTKARKPAR
jgi:rod shape-determining protein MreD